MSLPVVLIPEARREFDEAIDWLEERWPGKGEQFAEAVQHSLDLISVNPAMHDTIHRQVRRAVVSGFKYYSILYRGRSENVEVLSIFHSSRNPNIWKKRSR